MDLFKEEWNKAANMSENAMVEPSFPTCLKCHGLLMGSVSFCPYCGERISTANIHKSDEQKKSILAEMPKGDDSKKDIPPETSKADEEKKDIPSVIPKPDKQKRDNRSEILKVDDPKKDIPPETSKVDEQKKREQSRPKSKQISIGKWIVILLLSASVGGGLAYHMRWFEFSPKKSSEIEKLPLPPQECPQANILALETRSFGNELSLSVSKLPKVEKVLESAQKLHAISPASYQEQLDFAKEAVKKAQERINTDLKAYKTKLLELTRLDHQQVLCGMGQARQGNMPSRQKAVLELVDRELQQIDRNGKISIEMILDDFSMQFSNFIE